jgi:hypothetical protein
MVGHTFFDPAFLAFNPIATLNGGGTLTGASLTQTGQGMLDVVNGWGDASVESYLGRNTAIPDNLGGFGDVVLTSSSNNLVINPFDMFSPLGNSCRDPRTGPEVGDWCLQGTLNARGVVPEPGTLALLGLGLFGFGALRRRKQA